MQIIYFFFLSLLFDAFQWLIQTQTNWIYVLYDMIWVGYTKMCERVSWKDKMMKHIEWKSAQHILKSIINELNLINMIMQSEIIWYRACVIDTCSATPSTFCHRRLQVTLFQTEIDRYTKILIQWNSPTKRKKLYYCKITGKCVFFLSVRFFAFFVAFRIHGMKMVFELKELQHINYLTILNCNFQLENFSPSIYSWDWIAF